jgi:hypothetical protein
MIIQKYNNEEEWLEGRLGRVTGTRLKDLVLKRSTKPKIGYYEILAERVAIPANEENVMDRGHRLELDAVERFTKETGKVVNTDLVIWYREDNKDIAISPDGYIENKGKVKEALEVKCLSSARHIEAWLTQTIPDEYYYQLLQYFIVNDDLETLYFCFYDPRMPKDFFYITFKRSELAEEIKEHIATERQALIQLAQDEEKLTF